MRKNLEKKVQKYFLRPNFVNAYLEIGELFKEELHREKEAEYYFRKAIEIDPSFALGHFNLGIVMGIQKKFESAAPHFLKAIELDKQYEKPFVIQMLTALGKYNPSDGKPINQPKRVKKTEPVVEEAKVTTTVKEEKKQVKKIEHYASETKAGKKIPENQVEGDSIFTMVASGVRFYDSP